MIFLKRNKQGELKQKTLTYKTVDLKMVDVNKYTKIHLSWNSNLSYQNLQELQVQ